MTLEEMFCDLYDKYGKDFNRYMIPIAQPDGAFVTELKKRNRTRPLLIRQKNLGGCEV